jgi:hypothetical protein
LRLKESAREELLVNGAGAPLAKEDSGTIELTDGTSVAYRAIAPDNASALQRFHHRLSYLARCADTYEAGKGIILFIGNGLVSLLDSLKTGVER